MKTQKLVIMAAVLGMLFTYSNGLTSDRIEIDNIQVISIQSLDSLNQCALVLNFQYPNQIDSSEIIFAELRARISYQLHNGLPLTLACAPVMAGQQFGNVTYQFIRDSLATIIDRNVISTASFGGNSGDIARFDISEMFRKCVRDNSSISRLLIIPLDWHSQFFGLNQNNPLPEIEIRYMHLTTE